MFSRRSAQLALQATLLLATEQEIAWRRVRDIAAALGVSAAYLTKVLQGLKRAGLLRAVRGVGHGVQLGRPPREIRLWDILSAMEPMGEFERCFLGLDSCSDVNPCPFHEFWAPIRTRVLEMLQTKTLEELAAEARSTGILGRAGEAAPAVDTEQGRRSPACLPLRQTRDPDAPGHF